MSDLTTLPAASRDSRSSVAPTPLFGNAVDVFVQQLRLAGQALRAGRIDEAIASYLKLLGQRPYHAELHNSLGTALRQAGKLEAAVEHHRLSLAADPENPALHSNLGNALRAANRPDEAVRHHFRSIALNREYADGFLNLALCLRDLGRVDEAVGCFAKALLLNPENKRARVDHAIALLMRGDLADGFAAYEQRKRLPEIPAPDFAQPAWDGGPVEGRRVLLYPEQGLSDVLLFVRFARELKRRRAIVIVLCQAPLKDLLKGASFVDEVVAEGESLPRFDLHASMVSLPHLCKPDFATCTEPYLRAPDAGRVTLGRLDKAKLRIGIYWGAAGSQPQDRLRSAPLKEFLAFAGDPELLVFSLQGGAHQKDVQQLGATALLHDVGRGLFDFADAASALSQLDLVVSIDAPIAHLAAAMGLRTWVLQAANADWRWQLGGTRAPWYPSARLFGQPTAGDWASVFASVRAELELLKLHAVPASGG